jgi:hypothetical protein
MNLGQTGRSVELLWNKGMAALCDWRIPDEFPDGVNYTAVPTLAGKLYSRNLPEDLILNPSFYRSVKNGDLIWVRLSWLKSFVKQVLPLIESQFVLVTADSDSCVPSETLPESREILKSPKVVRWYSQNYDGSVSSTKILPIPIGLDFHTLSEKPVFGEKMSTPLVQEQTLEAIRRDLPTIENRMLKVYVDFGWQRGFGFRHHRLYYPLKGTTFHESRRALGRKLQKNPLVYSQSGPLSRSDLWRKRGEYAFVLSPHGMGLDCHRTWEALALGHIVLVPSSSLCPLYEGLPIVSLKTWEDITPENLENWLLKFRGFSDHSKLRSSFWVNSMRSSTKQTTAHTSRMQEYASQQGA